MKFKSLFYLILLTLLTLFIPAMHAQTFSVIHAFTAAEGANPNTGVTIRGNALYGALLNAPICGTVYQLTHPGSNWLFSKLAPLPNNSCAPFSRVVFGPDGHLYGAALAWDPDAGGVFKLTPQVGPCRDLRCFWNVKVAHQFVETTEPSFGELIWDQLGDMYGTTQYEVTYSHGTVYELTPSGDGYTESVLYSFSNGPDGEHPSGGLVFDRNGNLFGVTTDGGSNHVGTVFELTYAPGVGWTEHVLYNFGNADDGFQPIGGLVFDSSNNLYGTTRVGGSGRGGTVFELSPSGDTWSYKVLYNFYATEYCGPQATLSIDGAGNLYGTTLCAGIYYDGNVFKLSNTENGWVYSSLHDFTGGIDGGGSYSYVTIDTDGTLYGTAFAGGDFNCSWDGCGVVWMIKP